MTQKTLLGSSSTSTAATASVTWYGTLNASGAFDTQQTVEARAQVKCRTPGTLSNLRVTFATNARTTPTVVTIRVNGADTLLTVSSTASTANTVSDTNPAHAVTLADGDLVCYSVTNGSGTGNISLNNISVELDSTVQAAVQIAGQSSSAFGGTIRYFQPFGLMGSSATEANVLSYAPEAMTLSNLQAYISVNASTGFTVKSRKNGADGGMSIPVGSTAVGLFEDTLGSDHLVAGDTYAIATTTNNNSATVTQLSYKVTSDTSGHTMIGGALSTGTLGSGVTRFGTFFSNTLSTSVEGNAQIIMPYAANLSNLVVRVDSNASSSNVTVVLRVNGVDTTQVITITPNAGTSLFYMSAGAAVAVVAGDLVGIKFSGSNGNVIFSESSLVIDGGGTISGGPTPHKFSRLFFGVGG